MSAVFLDSSYVIALLSQRDAYHQQAVQLRPVFVGPLITTEYVLIELLDSLSDRTVRRVAAEAARGIRRRADVQVAPTSNELSRWERISSSAAPTKTGASPTASPLLSWSARA